MSVRKACIGCGIAVDHETEGVACRGCRMLYPPNLIRACHTVGTYAACMVGVSELHVFSAAKLNGRWATIRTIEGADVDIQLEHVVFVLDQASLGDDQEPELERAAKHDPSCRAWALGEDSATWLTVLDENNRPHHERCRYCKVKRALPWPKAEAPKRKGNIR